ncbi:unnamed protein product [Periconia digitata]|uniref:Flavin-containing monooxygenase n=1 Tax=Periconia digitata TaxID=1303443 RepID=A0A9W4XLR5_9PLEO|nr:unnamed protein product [Periconia digitata]
MGDVQDPASAERVEPGSVNIPLGEFPASCKSASVDAVGTAQGLVDAFNDALSQSDGKYGAIAKLFLEENSYWRDHLALSWALRTVKGRHDIVQFLENSETPPKKIQIDFSSSYRAPRLAPIDSWGDVKGIQFFITFETAVGRGEGVVRLAEENGMWFIFTISMVLKELIGYEEPVGKRRVFGTQHGDVLEQRNWAEVRDAQRNFVDSEPKVLVIGAGQGGLAVAARLRMLNVPTLVIEKNKEIGDNWRNRYHQLVLHDPVWFDHLPYIPFPSYWPVFTPKDKLAEFFQSYAQMLDLNVWSDSNLDSVTWDPHMQQWTVQIQRGQVDGGETRTFHPRHIIQATGHSGEIYFPEIKGIDTFQGQRLCHSSEFTSPSPSSSQHPKKAIVVGSCNSGHDIAHDFYDKGYDVTMVQRSTTCVISSESTTKFGLKGMYDEESPPVDDADLVLQHLPSALFKAQQAKLTKAQNAHDKALLDGLAKAGFGLDKGPNDAGLFTKYFQRGGGYYIDVGASQLIIDGKIKLQKTEIDQVLPRGVRFLDGVELEADEIVFATGYQNMKTRTRTIFGDDIADQVESVWGFNGEGEIRTMWQRSGHPGLWFTGGNFMLTRYFSRILALQIKALEEGIAQV